MPQPGQPEALPRNRRLPEGSGATGSSQTGIETSGDGGSGAVSDSGSLLESQSRIVVYDDPEPAAAEARSPAPTSELLAPWIADAAGGTAGPSVVPGQPLPSGMVLFRRSTLYVQAGLLMVVAAAAFGAGFVIGRGEMRRWAVVEELQAARQRVVVRGKLSYRAAALEVRPDADAVVIAFPAGQYPPKPFSADGLRPRDPVVETHRTIDAIRKLGGDYARADAAGDFTLDVSGQGRYQLLMISAHARRDPDALVDEADLESLRRYFHLPEQLIGSYQYLLETHTLQIGMNPIERVFGQTPGR